MLRLRLKRVISLVLITALFMTFMVEMVPGSRAIVQAATISNNESQLANEGTLSPSPYKYPYAPTQQSYLDKAMLDTVNIAFQNRDAANDGNVNITTAFASIAQAIAGGNHKQEYVNHYVATIRKMLTVPANMPNLQAGLDSRGQSPMVYAIALLWHNEEVMSQFTDAEKQKLITFMKAGLYATAYTISDYDHNGNLRPGNRTSMNGDTNNWIGTGPNYWEPNLTIFYAASFIFGLENVKDMLHQYDHAAFIQELGAQGLSTIKASYEKTINYESLASKAAIVEGTLRSEKWSFKGATLDQFLANPMALFEAVEQHTWSHVSDEGEFIGEVGMQHEFDSTDAAGPRESISYVAFGVSPSVANLVLMKYFGFWDVPGNEERAHNIMKLYQVGLSDYYTKAVNGYFTQSWLGTKTESLQNNGVLLLPMELMTSTNLVNLSIWNDTFNYANLSGMTGQKWTLVGEGAELSQETIIPYNIKSPLTTAPGATAKDPAEKVLKLPATSSASLGYSNQRFADISYQAWVMKSEEAAGEAAILGRVQDADHYYKMSHLNGKLLIVKVTGGESTVLAEQAYTMNANQAYRLRAELIGESLKLYVNGQLQLEATDSEYSEGSIGVYAWGTTAKFDGLIVQHEKPPAPELNSVRVGQSQLSLQFSPVPGANYYKVYYGTAPGQYTHSFLTGTTNPTLPSLNNGTVYYTAVSAIAGKGESELSQERSASPAVPTAVVPELKSIVSDGPFVTVNFTTDAGSTSYSIKVGDQSGNYNRVIENVTGSGYRVQLQAAQTPYYFAVSATNEQGESANSNQLVGMANSSTLYAADFATEAELDQYQIITGTYSLDQNGSSGRLKANGSAFERIWLKQGKGWKDYSTTVKMSYSSAKTTSINQTFMLGRATDTANYYLTGYEHNPVTNVGTIRINRKMNNVMTMLKEKAMILTPGQEYELRTEYEGNQVRLYIDGQLQLEVTDATPLLAGSPGFLSVDAYVYYDDLVVESRNGLEAPILSSVTAETNQAVVQFSEVAGADGYKIKYGEQAGSYTHEQIVTSAAEAGVRVTGLSAGRTYQFAVSAFHSHYESANSEVKSITLAGGTPSTPAPSPTSTPSPTPVPTAAPGSSTVELTPTLDGDVAKAQADAQALRLAYEHAEADKEGNRTAGVSIKSIEGAEEYRVELPSQLFTESMKMDRRFLSIETAIGQLVIPLHMFNKTELSGDSVTLAIGRADTSSWPQELQDKIGDQPVIELHAYIGDKQVNWSNKAAPVTVHIPYEPADQMRGKSEHITIWYIDGQGQITRVPSARYNEETGEISFRTTHFSTYAVAYAPETYKDLTRHEWARLAIEVLASKGIVHGVADKEYAPQQAITRADFLLLLVRTLELEGDGDIDFEDVSDSAYYSEAVRIAGALGIAQGKGENRFYPEAKITREDMAVLLARAIEAANPAAIKGEQVDMNTYFDADAIADYARTSMERLVESGLLQGNQNELRPKSHASRAEIAVLLYRLYNKLN
ncbi:S-layer homology domain-containing protein [Paenibacillus sp. GCM10023252]|uniref:S-layer homology domain-containing protein n=1 Tax=Paenibacillus sp. GCM10023252 TaxID=3252649 RepID=UPI00361E0BDD